MKTCPFCAEEIQDAAIACKHCGRDLVKPQDPGPPAPVPVAPSSAQAKRNNGAALALIALGLFLSFFGGATAGAGMLLLWIGMGLGLPGGGLLRWGGGFITALVLATVVTSLAGTGTTPTSSGRVGSTTSPAAAPATPQLALLATRGYESDGGGYHIVEGQVKNIGTEPIKNVTAVATWMDKAGGFIKSDDAMVDYNPILPGQTSPFKTMSSTNPAMSTYRVEFKTLFGGTLAVDDQRKK